MNQELQNFYLSKPEPYRSCYEALRTIILNYSPDFTEEWKYKLPFFYYKKKMCCYFWKDKKTIEPYIGFADGVLLDFPELEKGDRKRIKILRIDPNDDIPIELMDEVFAKIMELRR